MSINVAGEVLRLNKKMLIILTLGCLLACLTILASPAFASFSEKIDHQRAKITIVVKIHGTPVWLSYLDFVPIIDDAATVRVPKWLYLRLLQMLGTDTVDTPFTKRASLWTLPLEIMLTSRPQTLTIHFEQK